MIAIGLSRDPKSTEVIEDQEMHTQKDLAEEITWDESQEMYGHFTEVRNKKSRQRTKQVWLQIRCFLGYLEKLQCIWIKSKRRHEYVTWT